MEQFFFEFFNNVLAFLLCKIYVFDVFNMVDFFQIFVIERISEASLNFEISENFRYFTVILQVINGNLL